VQVSCLICCGNQQQPAVLCISVCLSRACILEGAVCPWGASLCADLLHWLLWCCLKPPVSHTHTHTNRRPPVRVDLKA
jgi:hypothetical protein